MEWLNYHHLRYFWAAAREGGVVRASQRLRVSQPTVSAQIRELETALGEKLFRRQGRRGRWDEPLLDVLGSRRRPGWDRGRLDRLVELRAIAVVVHDRAPELILVLRAHDTTVARRVRR